MILDREPASVPAIAGRELAFEVAGLRMAMTSGADGPGLAAPPTMDAFRSPSGRAADLNLSVHWAEEIARPQVRPAFASGGVWSLYRRAAAHEYVFQSPATGEGAYKTAILDSDYRRGRVWLSRQVFGGRPALYPLEYPLDELLVIHRLARGEGVEVHACGVRDAAGRGLLFTGHSGAGKSTLARLWLEEPGAQILSDDRIILRRDTARGGRITMHGTPWHGEARLALPLEAPLHAVYFLEHAAQNELRPLEPARAAAELAARSFLPYHSAAGLDFALGFFAALVAEVPCDVFRFVPQRAALRLVESND